MDKILNYAGIGLEVLLMFGTSIFVHELGHYLVALRRRMRVDAFGIGFGPKIISRVQNNIEYSIRWIPAGGFVKLPQMYTSEALEGGEASGREPIPPAPALSKILVALAGPVMNVIFAFLLAMVIYFFGLPVPVNPSLIGYVAPDSPEAKLGIRSGDRVVALDGARVRTWEDVHGITVLARSNWFAVDIERAGQRQAYRLEAKADNALGYKLLNLDPQEHPVVGAVEAGRPAEKAGLLPGDRFVSFAGVPVFGQQQLMDLIGKRAGQPSEAVMERAGQRLIVAVTPLMDKSLKRGRIGIQFGSAPLVYEVQRPGPTPWAQVAEDYDRTARILGALFHSRETGVGVKDLSGPPGILAMMAIQANTDWRLAVRFLVLLNLNLAILNLLPVPVLDGGHIMLAILEKVRRRPLSLRVMEYTSTVFFVLLLSLIAYVSFNDLKRFPRFRDVFHRPTTVEAAPAPAAPKPRP